MLTKSSPNMSLLLAGSFLNLMLCILIILINCHEIFSKFIPDRIIITNYVTPTASRLTRAWDFLLQYSLFPNPRKILVQENVVSIGLYEPEEGSDEVAECAVCLCKIEGGEVVSELRCGHMFHRDWLDRWFGHRITGTCPLCRNRITPSRMVNEVGEEVIVVKFSSSSPCNRHFWWLC